MDVVVLFGRILYFPNKANHKNFFFYFSKIKKKNSALVIKFMINISKFVKDVWISSQTGYLGKFFRFQWQIKANFGFVWTINGVRGDWFYLYIKVIFSVGFHNSINNWTLSDFLVRLYFFLTKPIIKYFFFIFRKKWKKIQL